MDDVRVSILRSRRVKNYTQLDSEFRDCFIFRGSVALSVCVILRVCVCLYLVCFFLAPSGRVGRSSLDGMSFSCARRGDLDRMLQSSDMSKIITASQGEQISW